MTKQLNFNKGESREFPQVLQAI